MASNAHKLGFLNGMGAGNRTQCLSGLESLVQPLTLHPYRDILATPAGVEPTFTDSKSVVLPLDEGAIIWSG